MEIKVKVVQHSSYERMVGEDAGTKEIITFELEYPRFIHSELMTHRVFSRNAASSRAIPIAKMMEQVENIPAMPVYWGLDKPGMQAKNEHNDVELCEFTWRVAANRAVESAKLLQALGLHKQVVNRVLEPFQMMKTIVTSTEWDNFYELRTHEDAQPEFRALAILMKEAQDNSEAFHLEHGEWHVPYVERYRCPEYENLVYHLDDEDLTDLEVHQALKVSASCCAQVSYRVLDDTLEKAEKIYRRLIDAKPIHASPFEHQASPAHGNIYWGNFTYWTQYRKILG